MNAKLLAALALILAFSTGPVCGQTFLHKFSSVGTMTELGMETVFVADDGTSGLELWKTGGSPEGTAAVTAFSWTPHLSQSHTQGFTSFQDKLYFSGLANENYCLKATDGSLLTTSGMRLLSRTFPKTGLSLAASIRLDSFPGGLYVLKISQGDKQTVYRIVKPF